MVSFGTVSILSDPSKMKQGNSSTALLYHPQGISYPKLASFLMAGCVEKAFSKAHMF